MKKVATSPNRGWARARARSALGAVFAGVLLVSGVGCVNTIAYAPRGAAAAAPEKQLEEALNLSVQPPARIEITSTHVKMIHTGMPTTTKVLRFSSVGEMKLQRVSASWAHYRVLVQDKAGDEAFQLWTNDIEVAKRFIDALAALRARTGAPPAG